MTQRSVDGVLIVGGGYAGVHAARAVRSSGRTATIVDPTGRHTFVTRLAAVAGGTAPESDASALLSDFADEVIVGSAVAVRDGEVDLADGTTLTAGAVVLTAGAVPSSPGIDGIEHAWPLGTEADALALRSAIADDDAVVIVGGGATGVQLAGSIAIAHPDVAVTLVEAADRLLAGMGQASGRGAARILDERGVAVRFGETVDAIGEHDVSVAGEVIDGLPVWAAGFVVRADSLGVPTDGDGRVSIDRYLRIDGWERTFAAGDIAHHRTFDGAELPMSAQVAVQAGEVAGRNAGRVLRGDTLDRARLSQRGWVLDLGGNRGVAEFGPIEMTGPFLDLVPPLLHWGIDVKHLIETRGLGGLEDRPGG